MTCLKNWSEPYMMHYNKRECLKYEGKYTDHDFFILVLMEPPREYTFIKYRKVRCLGPHKQHQS